MTFNPADHTIDEVHEHLEAHPEDTAAVLAAEQARGDDARSTLVSSLEGAAPDQQAQIEESPKPEDERISPPGEYPTDESAVPGTWGYESDAPGVQAGREASQPEA
jgi:hypothetical protein